MLSSCPPELTNCGPFYLTTISKAKVQVWFSRQRMGEHKIGQITKKMAVKSGLTAATAIRAEKRVQKLTNAGVPRDKITDVTEMFSDEWFRALDLIEIWRSLV